MAEHLFPAVSCQGKKAVVGKDDRIVEFRCIRKHHRHSRGFGGDDERAKVFPEAVNLGFGDVLLVGLVCNLRHRSSIRFLAAQSRLKGS